MKEKLYSTKEVAEHFGKTVDWVYRMVHEIGIEAKAKRFIDGNSTATNFYDRNQLCEIGRNHEMRLSKREKVTVFIQTTYYIFESKMNYLPDL